jgi:hypothetical protein
MSQIVQTGFACGFRSKSMSAWVWLKAWAMPGTIVGGPGDHNDTYGTIASAFGQILGSSVKSSIRLGASVLLCAAMLVSSQPALAQFTQQGSKLVGTGAVGAAQQGTSVALSEDGNTAIVAGIPTTTTSAHIRSGGVWTQQGSKLVADSSDCGQGFQLIADSHSNPSRTAFQ